MLPPLTDEPLPDWLRHLRRTLPAIPPLDLILGDSLYYPASGRDGSPVTSLAGFVHSFVYVDRSLEPQEVCASLRSKRRGFRGYRLRCFRSLRHGDVFQTKRAKPISSLKRKEGRTTLPMGCWAILERRPEFSPEHGPERFSFLFLRGDGLSLYPRLYNRIGIAPKVLALIRPGAACEMYEPCGHFAETARRNRDGLPRHILYDGMYGPDNVRRFILQSEPSCCWRGYRTLLGTHSRSRVCRELWRCDNPKLHLLRQHLAPAQEALYA